MLLDLLNAQLLLLAAALHERGFRLKPHEAAYRLRAFAHGKLLKVAPEQQQRDEHTVGEEVQHLPDRDGERDVAAVKVNYRCRQRDEDVHVHRPVAQAAPGAAVKIHARPELDHGCDHKLDKVVHLPDERHAQKRRGGDEPQQREPLSDLRLLLTAGHLAQLRPHTDLAQRREQTAAVRIHRPDADEDAAGLGVLLRALHLFHGAQRGEGTAHRLRVERGAFQLHAVRRNAEARFFHRGSNRRDARLVLVIAYERAAGRIVHRRVAYAVHGADCAVQPLDAGRAVDIADFQGNFFHCGHLAQYVRYGRRCPPYQLI